jgi:hypothetical protein
MQVVDQNIRNIPGDDTTNIPNADLHRRRDANLIVTSHIVACPDEHNWLSDKGPGYDEEQC